MPPESDVRSTTQSTALMPASLAASTGLNGSASPGRGVLGLRAAGSGGAGSFMSVAQLRGGEAPRVEVLADPVEVLARIAVAREPLELAVDGGARAHLDLAVADAGVEVVERPHRRTAGDLAAEVVDAAVARADEPRRGLRPADGAAEVHAPRGERDERLLRVERAVDRLVARPDVGRGL